VNHIYQHIGEISSKKIDCVSIAEASMEQFAIYGTPRVIHHDHEQCFMSATRQSLKYIVQVASLVRATLEHTLAFYR